MNSKKAITALSKVGEGGVGTLQKALAYNPLATATSRNPNAEKLKDGAIQRMSVQTPETSIEYKRNVDKVGVSMRPHKGVTSGGSASISTDPFIDYAKYQNKIAHIYMPQKKHVHNHAADKTMGKYWVIEFDTESTFKSPLMQWTSASNDCFYSKGDNLSMRFPDVQSAVQYAKMMGWGYSVMYPKFKYHTTKIYADNFKYKGEPKPEHDYD